jgi:hypothetical protein
MKRLNTDRINDHAPYYVSKPRTEYVAFIVQRNNPQIKEIINLFDNDISMFNEMKP